MSCIVRNTKLNYKELLKVFMQVQACMNGCPLRAIPHNSNEGIEVLTPAHFLISCPIQAIPDHNLSYQPLPLLHRWYFCEAFVCLFWKRWSSEYLISLQRYSKWCQPTRNLQVRDVVIVREDNTTPSQWPLVRIIEIHKGGDGLIRVVELKTKCGMYTRPVTKVALLLSCERQ